MLKVENLQYGYPGGPEVLKDISFTLGEGQFMAILGNNGAGKSTMLKCFNQILTPKAGSIFLNKEEILKLSAKEIAKRIAFVAQSVPNVKMTVHDMVMLGRKPYMKWGITEKDHEMVHEAMDKLQVSDMRGRFLNQLSGGERQKVMLARALAQEPKLLLLDEPTSSLDLQNQYQVLQIVQDICRDTKISAIVVIHDLNLALRFCDQFLLMKDGQVYASGDAEILTPKAIWDVYHIRGEVVSVCGQKMVLVNS